MNVTLYRGFRIYRILFVVVPIAYYELLKVAHPTSWASWLAWYNDTSINVSEGKVRFGLCIAIPLILIMLARDLHSRYFRRARLVFNSSMVIDEISKVPAGAIPWADIESFDIQRSLFNASVDIRIKARPGAAASRLQIGGLGISARQEQSIRVMSNKSSHDPDAERRVIL